MSDGKTRESAFSSRSSHRVLVGPNPPGDTMQVRPVIASVALLGGTLVALSGTSAQAAAARYEAETASAVCTGTIDSDWSGYSGSGFCNGTNAVGAYAQFTVSAPAAGTATLNVRFANGTDGARAANIMVNGSSVASASFETTGAWDTWATKTVTVPVRAGNNTVRLSPTSSAGLPNVDYVDAEVTGDDTTPPSGSALYVSPGGSDGASGTESDPTTLTSAIDRVSPGGTIYLRGGTYRYAQTVTVPQGNDGTSGDRTELTAYPGETPVLNFSAQSESSSNRGLAVNGSYWHVKGIVVEHAGDNGIFVGGSNNVFERTVTRFNRDTGLQLSRTTSDTPRDQWPSNNLILSAESHDNADSDGEDADGFAAKLTVGPGNVFRDAVSHNNIDDGWDLYTKSETGAIGAVTIEDSLAYENGTLSDGTQNSSGDRNGYKLGGEDIEVDHVVRRSIAYRNGKHGFTYNSNPGTMTISDNVSIDNAERNFSFDKGTSVFRNNTSCRADDGSNDKTVGDADGSNQFWTGSNGSRCAAYAGALDWSFDSDGTLVVTFGGNRVIP
ncbi:carbohydrate-binding protein [Streptomyces sp. SID7813]|uniref:Polysaccharide lyase n=4 Tax=Streptomyces TaxID=1883 RepID=Q9K457_STRCO|nr:polysaccharide lyase [Streptomyces lividans TK24]KKD15649.1 silent information regulator protein Sir2 [Streptomyces sp. WM6391]MYU46733.1 carbohydrate-binding protein [Streptomyces sp. SID7813]NSL83964.1 carbohydrate-binding protein [Streptomyces coelicolor]QFI46977.1 carbohydrate-binding protein [Streptomyces coelicolor A3(2)]THA93766.1 carbohydrate-binding protein [Streptomyces sp. LRa12]